MDEQRALLDSLFGNADVTDYRDPSVCRYYLCGFCPVQLFENTKIDVGACEKVHDDKLKLQFQREQAKNPKEYKNYYDDFEKQILKVMAETDRKIKRGQNKYYDRHNVEMSHVEDNDAVKIINRQIEQMKKRAETASEEGLVDEAATFMATVEKLREDKYIAQARYIMDFASTIPNLGAADGNTKLRVCDICGALLSVVDSEIRLADHFGGRIHQGYLLMKHGLQELKERKERLEGKKESSVSDEKSKISSSSSNNNNNNNNNTSSPPPPPPPLPPAKSPINYDGDRGRERERERERSHRHDYDDGRKRSSGRDREKEHRHRSHSHKHHHSHSKDKRSRSRSHHHRR